MSLYYDSGVLVKLYVREDRSDEVTRFITRRGRSVAVNRLHELEIRNALRLKRYRDEIDDAQLAASLGMIAADFAARRLVRHDVDWGVIHDEAERLSAVTAATVGVRTIDVIHIAAALTQMATGLVSFDRRQIAAARKSKLAGRRASRDSSCRETPKRALRMDDGPFSVSLNGIAPERPDAPTAVLPGTSQHAGGDEPRGRRRTHRCG